MQKVGYATSPLEDGSLDLPDSILGRLDLVVGAVHDHFNLSRKKQTERITRAMDSRYFTILAHPSGRLLFEREAYDVDMEEIIRKAADRGCVLELNSQPQRLDLTDVHCRQAQAEGGGRFPTLLHDTAWSREETLVLIHLRDRLQGQLEATLPGEFVFNTPVAEGVEIAPHITSVESNPASSVR